MTGRRRPRLPEGMATALGGGGRLLRQVPRGPLAALAPVVALLAVPLAVAAFRQGACVGYGWQGRFALWRQCGSPLLSAPGSPAGATGSPTPLARGVTALLEALAPGTGLAQDRWVLAAWMLLAAALLVLLVLLVGTVAHLPDADPVQVALSPVVALTVLLSVDLVAATLLTAAVWTWMRGRRLVAAVLLLVALAGTPYASPAAWSAGGGVGSLWSLPALAGAALPSAVVGALAALGVVATAVLLHTRWRRGGAGASDLVLLGAIGLTVTGLAYPFAAAIWFVPLLALAGLRWREHLVWAGAEAVFAVATYTWLDAASDPSHGLPAGWYALALVTRMAVLVRLGWVVWVRAEDRSPYPVGSMAVEQVAAGRSASPRRAAD